MFKAREIFYDSENSFDGGTMPKQMIQLWKEKRLIKIMLLGISIYAVINMSIALISYNKNISFIYPFPNFNSI